jgi:hypothetical protein
LARGNDSAVLLVDPAVDVSAKAVSESLTTAKGGPMLSTVAAFTARKSMAPYATLMAATIARRGEALRKKESHRWRRRR